MKAIFARIILLAACAAAATACQESTPPFEPPAAPAASAVKFWDANAATTWNTRATTHLAVLPNGSHAPASRMLTYLSIAQYRAALAAEAGRDGGLHPSVSAAIAAASVAVLSSFFPTAAAAFEAQLDADLSGPQWPGAQNQDAGTGEAIGRAVAASVLALAATDGFSTVSPGVPPVGPGFWVSSAAPIARSLYGTRPWFMSSTSELRSPPPPAFGSPPFLAALAEVRAISDTRTAEQLAIAQGFNQSAAPFTPGGWNVLAVDLIRRHHRTEREAARILAYANAAAFDAQIACFDTKFAYWFIRPSQADPAITLPIGLPNHPSYPSAHSCITGSMLTVLADAFPNRAAELTGLIEQAGLSRVYGGIHYRFDVAAGQEIGRRAAALALAGSLE
jgi:membrane-associated phospholipid phosphatase